MNKADLPPLTLIAGPTASGKSALALKLAAERPSVIVNADAMQVYADLRVLTARPSLQEEAAVPHRLYGTIDGAVAFSAAAWADAARAALQDAWSKGLHPILIGGTGLYIMTLLDGIAPVPDIDPDVRAQVRAMPLAEAYAALAHEDTPAAARLNANDTTRVARALEVVRSTGQSLSAWHSERSGGIGERVSLDAMVLDPPRESVIARADARVPEMLRNGAVDEVAALVARHLTDVPILRAIGVQPIANMLARSLSLDGAIEQIQAETRAYIKRQSTWARGRFPTEWRRVSIPDN